MLVAADVVVIGGTALATRSRRPTALEERASRSADGTRREQLRSRPSSVARREVSPSTLPSLTPSPTPCATRNASTGSLSSRWIVIRTPWPSTTSTERFARHSARRLQRGGSPARRPPCTRRVDPPLRGVGERPALPRLDDGHDGERRRRDPYPDPGNRARSRPRQCDPSRHRGRHRSGVARRSTWRTCAPARRPAELPDARDRRCVGVLAREHR